MYTLVLHHVPAKRHRERRRIEVGGGGIEGQVVTFTEKKQTNTKNPNKHKNKKTTKKQKHTNTWKSKREKLR